MKTMTATGNLPATGKLVSRIQLAKRLFLAFSMIVFGLNKFYHFIPVQPPADATAQQFLGTMFTTYLAPLVAFTEIVAGTLLFFRRTSYLGVLILLPVTVNIIGFHVAHDLPGNGLWLFTSMMHVLVLYSYRYEFKKFIL
jgi:putative oxidoreductase